MAVQRGRSERRPEAYPQGYVEDLSDARTKLAEFFSVLLERLVRAVTERRRLRLLAHAQGHFFRFIYCKLDRLDPGPLVGPITERLIPRAPTLTPIVRSLFQRQYFGLLGCNAWLLHERSSFYQGGIGLRGCSISLHHELRTPTC
jgi:hypothetical protein